MDLNILKCVADLILENGNYGHQLRAILSGVSSVIYFSLLRNTLYLNASFYVLGNSLYCWISNKTAILVAMVTPVGLAMAFNAVCLSKSIYSIYNLQQVRLSYFA